MSTVTKLSKAETAYRWIRDRITSGKYAPGDRLTLPTIAEALDISVVPVREAVRRLEAEGLATFERNIGAKVAAFDEKNYRDAMETLALLEGVATGLAAPFLDEEDFEKAEEINGQMEELISSFDPVAFTQLNQHFHQVLFDKCPNQRMIELVQAEWLRLRNLRESTFSEVPDRAKDSIAEHKDILHSLRTHQPTEYIEKVAREHVLATLHHLLSFKENQTSLTT